MNICCFLTNMKYFYYFHKLLFDIGAYFICKKITGCNSVFLINTINCDIKNNGFVIIKLIQWLLCRYTNLLKSTSKESAIYNFLENYKDVYENCNLHSFEYTEKIFIEDFSQNITDIIDFDKDYKIPSASVAQVYKGTLKSTGETIAIKVAHPELENQIVYPLFYYNIYCYITNNLKFLNIYTLPFDLSSFFNSFIKQINMKYEANNLEYFYNLYNKNPIILIPRPIFSSKNILVMEYIDGIDFQEPEISNFKKHKFILYLNLFVRNNLIDSLKMHSDLHSSNWKIVDDEKNPKIVIYDFGFCIDILNYCKDDIHNLLKSIETNNQMLFAKTIYNYLKTQCDKEVFLKDTQEFIDTNTNDITIIKYIEFCISKNYIFNSDILDITLSTFLVNNYFKKYTCCVNIEDEFKHKNINLINKLESTNNHLMTISSICDINSCCNNLNKYLKNFIDENRKTIIEIRQKNISDKLKNNKSDIELNTNDTSDYIDL